MQEQFSQSTGLTFQGTTTCEHSLPPIGIGASMSSAEDSLARTSATPEGKPGWPARGAVFGTSTLESLANYDRDTSSWRTYQRCLSGGWMPYSGAFPASGMTRSGTLYRLRPLVPRTAVKRVWIVAYSNDEGEPDVSQHDEPWRVVPTVEASDWWKAAEPDMVGVADGIQARVDRDRCLGNAVVPQVVEVIGRAIVARG